MMIIIMLTVMMMKLLGRPALQPRDLLFEPVGILLGNSKLLGQPGFGKAVGTLVANLPFNPAQTLLGNIELARTLRSQPACLLKKLGFATQQ